MCEIDKHDETYESDVELYNQRRKQETLAIKEYNSQVKPNPEIAYYKEKLSLSIQKEEA